MFDWLTKRKKRGIRIQVFCISVNDCWIAFDNISLKYSKCVCVWHILWIFKWKKSYILFSFFGLQKWNETLYSPGCLTICSFFFCYSKILIQDYIRKRVWLLAWSIISWPCHHHHHQIVYRLLQLFLDFSFINTIGLRVFFFSLRSCHILHQQQVIQPGAIQCEL